MEQTNLQLNEDENSSEEEDDRKTVSSKNINTEDASKKLSGLSNPKYFLKLGIMKRQMTGIHEENSDEVAEIIGQLIDVIKLDCTLTIFKNELKRTK